jgi:hypothetical protein
MSIKRVVFAPYLPIRYSGFGWESIVVYMHTDGTLTEGTAVFSWQRDHSLLKHTLLRVYDSQQDKEKRMIDLVLEEAM